MPESAGALRGATARSSSELRCAPYPYAARAWWGDVLVAQSDACLRVEEPEREPALYFPWADIETELFHDEGHRLLRCPVKGEARCWSIADAGDVLWRFDRPSAEFREISDYGTFDTDRVRIDVVDAVRGDEARDITVKRFPTWGDAADLLDVLDVRPEGERSFVSVTRAETRRPVVEGSQMLGQAIVAASRRAQGRRVVSGHMIFIRPADARQPLRFHLDELSAGRVFSALSVQVFQGERRCAAGTLLLDATSEDVIRRAVEPPDVPGPYESEVYDMGVTGRDIRMVDGAYTNDPDAPIGPPVLDSWVRFREVPDDPALHAALLAQFTGHLSIAAALRPHEGVGQHQAHRTLSTAINAITISFHRAVRADRWMLYHHLSTFAGDGMTHAECRVHDGSGHLLASFTVEGMVRNFGPGTPGTVDERTAL
jgi:acyl-CoA thioesterase II